MLAVRSTKGSIDFLDRIILVYFVGCLATGTGLGRFTTPELMMKLLKPEAGVVGLLIITNLLVDGGTNFAGDFCKF